MCESQASISNQLRGTVSKRPNTRKRRRANVRCSTLGSRAPARHHLDSSSIPPCSSPAALSRPPLLSSLFPLSVASLLDRRVLRMEIPQLHELAR